MPRYVDTLPPAVNPKEKQVIVLSFGRNGTLGLYTALGKLGYNPCHMKTVLMGGAPEVRMMKEVVMERHSPNGKRYNKDDLDKWLGQYDALTDITPFFMEEAVAAWPDAKFILTTREPAAWYASAESTILRKPGIVQLVMMGILRWFSPLFWEMSGVKESARIILFGGGEFMNKDDAIRAYIAHNEKARSIVPKDQLLEVKLEDGLGWEQICPFLGKEIPNEPYPRTNSRDEFKELHAGVIKPHMQAAMAKLVTTIIVPLAAAGAWYYMRYVKN
ncbi:uncharacterized protein E0L32_005292 [Thyridium curvatum]|uniref:NAD dependent epimerase/dehydratase n=1 Tax=Thyridium curvatum TaxID=1093900 RepID=A0A507BDE7_9PEZI|nr:uncharacterized protein E0L32_005292 [Thyridium curvatum]TPX14600.1 hypothetical protein E0L32_005292 [Thyridium curvatum]